MYFMALTLKTNQRTRIYFSYTKIIFFMKTMSTKRCCSIVEFDPQIISYDISESNRNFLNSFPKDSRQQSFQSSSSTFSANSLSNSVPSRQSSSGSQEPFLPSLTLSDSQAFSPSNNKEVNVQSFQRRPQENR